MFRWRLLTLVWAFSLFPAFADDSAKEALRELGDFVGEWKGDGVTKVDGKEQLWKETFTWGWAFEKSVPSLKIESKEGRYLTSGQLGYDTKLKRYTLEIVDADKSKQHFEGEIVKKRLVVKRTDSKTSDVERLTINTVADGARMTIVSEVQSKGKGIFQKRYELTASNTKESFAGGGKKPECIVTGGLGTITVSYEGKTYYVCCSGCRDEFNANPKKFVEAYEKKKK